MGIFFHSLEVILYDIQGVLYIDIVQLVSSFKFKSKVWNKAELWKGSEPSTRLIFDI